MIIFTKLNNVQNSKLICYCFADLIVENVSMFVFSSSLIVILLISIGISYWAQKRTENLLTKHFSGNNRLCSTWNGLQGRFLLTRNLNVMKSILPITMLHTVLSIGVLILGNFGRLYFIDDVTGTYISYRTFYMSIHALEHALFPIIFVR